ncbi:hypothetical protein RHSP_15546 [Rhizobium freirei PRF 81]|uniref:Uncharacterized protein n=1 Tax=Rhizobium freirei PRF 81 TaxID=363754 RepID=N6V1G3_9HYPH|nr:hypothetical protein RHSP_15546 [Rhizobium freirei PRF 81]
MARAHDHLVGRLVRPRTLALGRLAPWGHRMATTGGAAFTTAVRMVDRVHDDAAVMRLLATPTRTTSLTVVDVGMIRVGNRTDRCEATAMHEALFAGVQAKDRHALVTTDELGVGASRTSDLTALARLHFHVVDDRADRDELKWHGVARLHVHGLFRSDDLVAGSEALRSEDVGQLAVRVLHQSDVSGTVRIVFDALDRCFDVELATLEVYQTVAALVTATLETHGDAAGVVAAALGGQAFRQRLDRLALVERGAIDDDQLTLARGRRIECFQCHFLIPQRPVETSIDWPSASVTIAFFTSFCLPTRPLNRLVLPRRSRVLTAVTLTPNSASTAALISGFVAVLATLKTTWLLSESRVDFSVIAGETITS